MNCPNCGNAITEKQNFCRACGAKLSDKTIGKPSWLQSHFKLVFCATFLGIPLVLFCMLGSNNTTSKQYNPYNSSDNIPQNTSNIAFTNTESPMNKSTDTYIAPKPICVYKTNDGVCFTTKAFTPKPMGYYDCTGGLTTYEIEEIASNSNQHIGIRRCYSPSDYWAGAMKMCNDWGYKLPSKADLNSLAKDIYGVYISDEYQSYLPAGKSMNSNLFNNLGVTFTVNSISFWEDTAIDSKHANERIFGIVSTKRDNELRGFTNKIMAVCVYNPHGKPKTTYQSYVKEEQERPIKEEQQKREDAENDLF